MTKTRRANSEDIPAVAKVILAAVNNERLWTKFVPSRSDQDASYFKQTEALLQGHLADKSWIVEVTDLEKENKAPAKIVSVAIWTTLSATNDDLMSVFPIP